MKYVQRRADRYEFRFPLPDDLAGQWTPSSWPEGLNKLVNRRTGRLKTELIRTLLTKDRKLAEERALAEIAEAHHLIRQARQVLADGPPDDITGEEIEALGLQHKRGLLEADERIRSQGIDPRRDNSGARAEGMSEEDFDLYRFLIDDLDRMFRNQAARMRPGETTALQVNRALERQGRVLHPEASAWRHLELAFLEAEREAFDGIKARSAGDYVPTPTERPQTSTTQLRISEALRRWAEGGAKGVKRPSEGARTEAARAVQRFIQLHGDLPLELITKRHGREFRDALAKVPKALPRRWAEMTLPGLLQLDLSALPGRSAQTVNKTLALLSGIVARAERDGFLEAVPGWTNPFHTPFEISTSDRLPYEPFTLDELSRLFSSPIYSGGLRPAGGRGEAGYWLPLLALFTGARRTELAQLRIEDVREGAEGVWFIDITEEGEGQRLKNQASRRSVPIHSQLINLGFLRFVAERKGIGEGGEPLWPGFVPPIDTKLKSWSKWFGRYLAAHVVDDRAKTFHSFRHTFKRACREAGISEEIHNAFTGHAGGGIGRGYGRERRLDGALDRGVSLARLKAEIDKVHYPGIGFPGSAQG